MSLQQRIKKIEDVARPMIEDRERRIDAYIVECKRRGYDTTRREAEYAHDFIDSEMARLEHLPMPERRLQVRINFSIDFYRKRTGASEGEAIAALKPYIPELCTA